MTQDPHTSVTSSIAKVLVAEIRNGEGEINFRLNQVGAQALIIPSRITVRRQEDGRLGFEWQWLPGQAICQMDFDRAQPLGPCFEQLVAQLRQTRPKP